MSTLQVEFYVSVSGYFQSYTQLLNLLCVTRVENDFMQMQNFSLSIEKSISNKLFIVKGTFIVDKNMNLYVMNWIHNLWNREELLKQNINLELIQNSIQIQDQNDSICENYTVNSNA